MNAILSSGFKDRVGTYLANRKFRGVWFSDRPILEGFDLTGGGIPENWAALEVRLRLSPSELERHEWLEEGKTYREWLIPARE